MAEFTAVVFNFSDCFSPSANIGSLRSRKGRKAMDVAIIFIEYDYRAGLCKAKSRNLIVLIDKPLKISE